MTFKQQTEYRAIDLGTDTSGSLSLTDTELNRVTVGTIAIGNSTSGTITNTFAGLSEGASVTINSVPFKISYVGGDGNDVVLSQTEVSVSVAPVSVTENGTGNLEFTFTRVGTTGVALTVNFDVSGSAAFSSDYTQTGAATYAAASGTVTFAAGSSTAVVTLDPTADSTVEANETTALTITSGTGYETGSPPLATGVITNDDSAQFNIASNAGLENAGAITFTVTLTNPVDVATSVNVSTVDDTAVSAQTLSFAAGETSHSFMVTQTADSTVEANETITFSQSGLVNGGYATVTTGTNGTGTNGTGAITNDDTATYSIDNATIGEGGNLSFTVSLSNAVDVETKINVSFANVSTADDDFTHTAQQVTFAAGTTTAQGLSVATATDSTVEANETLTASLALNTALTGGRLSATGDTGTGTIGNDDLSAVSVAVSPVGVAEDGTPNLRYTFTRTNTSAQTPAMFVNFSVGGTATVSTDFVPTGAATFTATTGTVRFSTGSSTAVVIVNPTSDATVEPDETVLFTVTSGSGYIVGSPLAQTGTITNDDMSAVRVAVSRTGVVEDRVNNLVYTFTRSNTSLQTPALTINFDVAGTATFNTDYAATGAATMSATTGTATFPAGTTTVRVIVDPASDTTDEPTETVLLTVTAGSGYTVGSPLSATALIYDDDPAPSLSINDAPSVSEPSSGTSLATFTVTLSAPSGHAVTVTYATANGTAAAPDDYDATNGSLTFLPGETQKQITVQVKSDALTEQSETLQLKLLSAVNAVFSDNVGLGTILDQPS